MKKLFTHMVTAVLGSALIMSCTLERLPLNGPSTEGFPSTEEEALAGVYAAYKEISSNRSIISVTWWRIIDCMTDIGTYRVTSGIKDIMMSTATPSFSWSTKMYSRGYSTISRIHLVLDNIDNLKGTVSDETLDCMKAELLLMRAFYYDQLVQYFGDVPWIDHSLTLEDRYYPRTRKDTIVANILGDLSDEVMDALPVRWNKSTYGTTRLSRVAAYMLKARIYLNHADLSPDYMDKALEYSERAISMAKDAGHVLAEYDTTYSPDADAGEPNCKLFSYAGQTDDEWIWALQYNKLIENLRTVNIYYIAPRVLNGASWTGPSQAFIDLFQCTDGLYINESPLYNWQDPWANRDPRLDLFCVRDGSRTMGVEYSIDITKSKVKDYHTGAMINNSDAVGNKSEYGPNGKQGPGGYLWRKGYDDAFYGNITGSSTDKTQDDINVGMLRLAELYLIAAEANIESAEGSLTRAAELINAVRNRAGMPDLTVSDKAGLRKALRYERTVELCDEGLRWYDLRRWGIAEKAVGHDVMAPGYSSEAAPRNFISNVKPTIDDDCVVSYGDETWDGNASNLRVFQRHRFTVGRDELWPIPQEEIDSNNAISPEDQNPGY